MEDSGLLGPGVVCGNGSEMRRLYPGPRAMMQLVRAVDCRRLRFEGVTLRDSEFWNTHILLCEDVKDGVQAHNVAFCRINVRRCNRPFDVWVMSCEDEIGQTRFSTIRDITIKDLCIDRSGIEGSNQTSHIAGRDAAFDVRGVTLRGLQIDGQAIAKSADMDIEINQWVSGLSWE